MQKTAQKTTRDLVNEHHTLGREPERMAVDTIEELLLSDGFEPTEIAAGFVFVLREMRAVHPNGEFDKGGRWYPDSDETCDCCDTIRSPSRAYPYSFMVHCRTIKHVSNLYEVKPGQTRKVANLIGTSDATDSFRRYSWVD